MACNVGTVREIRQRLVAEGFNVSEYALRMWIKNGTLRAVYSGNKALISYDRVIEIIKVKT